MVVVKRTKAKADRAEEVWLEQENKWKIYQNPRGALAGSSG